MKIRNDNYICIQGWMCNDPEYGGLGLKGNDLIVFAVIYGFCQQAGKQFSGSLAYIAEWANSTKAGIIKNLTHLQELGLIIKYESSPTNIYEVNIKALPVSKAFKQDDEDELNSVNPVNSVNKVLNSVTQSVNRVNSSSIQSLPNNIDNNINNIDNKEDGYKANAQLDIIIKDIIQYLNNKCNTNFKYSTSDNKRLVKKRLNEGYTVDDFKKVIDCKWDSWGEKPFMFKNGVSSIAYLRPATLFGDKFESYLHESSISNAQNNFSVSESVPIESKRSGFTF